MRDIQKVNQYQLSMQELADITKDVYGIAYDIQMGEKSNGTYEVHETEPQQEEGYYTGLVKQPNRDYPNYDEAEWIELTDEEAIERWQRVANDHDLTDWRTVGFRPFDSDKLTPDGEYIWYQPDINLVLADLANRNEIPRGIYMITIDW